MGRARRHEKAHRGGCAVYGVVMNGLRSLALTTALLWVAGLALFAFPATRLWGALELCVPIGLTGPTVVAYFR
jgi:hypothetical protein